jgi:SAM-dependent methyltransferase
MKFLDRLLQRWRVAKARPYISANARVLDIGCDDGALFRLVPAVGEGVGIDPFIPASSSHGRFVLIKGWFPQDLPDDTPYDAITLLAVLEHLPVDQQVRLAEACTRCLKPGGRLLITVPSPAVDRVLAVLKFLRVIDGMSLEQHYGFDAGQTPALFTAAGLRLLRRRRFQLGLNNFFAFEKPGPSACHSSDHPPLAA